MFKPLDELASTEFVPLLNDKFTVRLDGQEPTDLQLIQVAELGAARSPEHRAPFSLIFLGPVSSLYLRQATYRLEHARMGSIDLFIVPLGPQQGRMQYQAIFS